MRNGRKTLGTALVALTTAGALGLAVAPASADFAPQPTDVVTTGSDIIQTSFNFLADGYHELPGYNTAGNRWRFVNFDSSGDAQGRSAYIDPRLLPTITGNGTLGENGVKYVKQNDIQLLNPTISLRAGGDLVVRPSGGGGGGRDGIVNDAVDANGVGGWIDVGRSPTLPRISEAANDQNTAFNKLGTRLYTVRVGTDRQLIATAETTNAPTSLSGTQIREIYTGTYDTWGDLPGYSGPGVALGSNPAYDGPAKDELIRPLTLPSDAGMWTTFIDGVKAQVPGSSTFDGLGNPNKIQVQQNDPTAITALTPEVRRNAIVPFPRGRYKVVEKGYYTQANDGAGQTNPYNGTRPYTNGNKRISATVTGVKLLDPNGTAGTAAQPDAPYGTNFGYNGIFRKSDFDSTAPWQPGSTLNWVQTLFYNPDGPAPFVNTPAGKALLTAAGITPDYQVFDENNTPLID